MADDAIANVRQEQPLPRAGALAVILAPIFMVSLDFFIVNVAVPSVQRDLHAGSAAIQFMVAGYGLAYAAGLITGGRLGDLYGRRRMYVTGLMLFTLASLLCGLSPNPATLDIGRVAQGVAAALMSPQALAMVTTLYPGESRKRAFTAYGLAVGLGGVLGQLVGGLLIQANIADASWRPCFLINIPFGLAALTIMPRLVPETRSPARARPDVTGAVLLTLGLVAVVLPLVEGRQQHWPAWSWLCLAAALPLFLVFGGYEQRVTRRGRAPLVDLGLLRERPFAVGLVAELAYFSGSASFFLIFTIYLQEGYSLNAAQAGLLAMPIGVGFLGASFVATRLAGRLGKQVLAVGMLAQIAGWGLLYPIVANVGVSGAVALLTPALLILGAGSGLVMAPLASIVLMGVTPRHAGTGSGVLSTALQVGNALGVAVIGVVFYDKLGPAPAPTAFPAAFNLSVIYLIGLGVFFTLLVQYLPGRPAAGRPAKRAAVDEVAGQASRNPS